MHLYGFRNHHQTEAIEGALPKQQNSPQNCPFGLYAEQLSGSAFTRSRSGNLYSWLYRILPSVVQGEFIAYKHPNQTESVEDIPPNPMRFSPFDLKNSVDFIDGLHQIASTENLTTFIYMCDKPMNKRYFTSFDGELLFVPFRGETELFTEFGKLVISPGMVAVIGQGIKFKLTPKSTTAEGYLCENRGLPLELPEHGPIGPNSLANPRHFQYPKACYEDISGDFTIVCKYQNNFWEAQTKHSPLNVVAWHGNHAPYCYDLSLFNTINTVSFDHPDPSIFTVLTSPSSVPGVANLDFVIFPPRWMVAEDTFRPPYFHRNVMNELMGLVMGTYDAKADGFNVGGISIHNQLTGHGPDAQTVKTASNKSLKPEYYHKTLAFMFESKDIWKPSQKALNSQSYQKDYAKCWLNIERKFKIKN